MQAGLADMKRIIANLQKSREGAHGRELKLLEGQIRRWEMRLQKAEAKSAPPTVDRSDV